jgi:quercetin dioxygenase-like cupin family protein
MFSVQRCRTGITLLFALHIARVTVVHAQNPNNDIHNHRLFPCMEDGLKSSDSGCQLLAKMQIARFPEEQLFWYLDRFPTKEAAEARKGKSDLVVEAEGKFWLFSFGPKSAAQKQGQRVATIGPLPLTSTALPRAKSYEIVAYLAVMPPDMYTRVHIHPGPEAWYVLSGQQCLETPAGVIKTEAGESAVAPPMTPMRLTNNGSSARHALFIVIHDASQPWTIPTDEWKPSGACDR